MFYPKQLIIYPELKTQSKRKFTSDASHELRTPLTIKGTLEVLIRKPRNSSEYEEKSTFVFMK
jgi:signal transduction histidine kinase